MASVSSNAPYLEGLRVKHRLLDLGKRQAWLIEEMKKKDSEMYLDSSYMTRLLDGREKSAPKMTLINQILEEEEKRQGVAYESNH